MTPQPEGPPDVVAAVVPAFHPGPDLPSLVRDLITQTGGRVVVVDDSGGRPADVLATAQGLGALVVRHETNAGIGAALTTGVSAARARWPGLTGVLTVDQDSRLAPDHLSRLLQAGADGVRVGLQVGLVGPEEVEGLPSRAARRHHHHRHLGVLLGREPVQSGLLVPLTVWEEVGGVDATLFIDGVDSDLWLKVLDSGRQVVVAPGLRVAHRLGTAEPLVVAGRPLRWRGNALQVPVSAPFRSYYLVRNRLLLVARHGCRHPVWAGGQLVGLARHLVLTLLLDPPGRRERLGQVREGLQDAVRRRAGPSGPRPER